MSHKKPEKHYPKDRHEARELRGSFKGVAKCIRDGWASVLREWRRNEISKA
ncbi:MAG: hypothetical protein WC880_01385 [Candidatus Paceibacterota bacterium]